MKKTGLLSHYLLKNAQFVGIYEKSRGDDQNKTSVKSEA
jgi:hypothetical protein